jgi:hypothetical protein
MWGNMVKCFVSVTSACTYIQTLSAPQGWCKGIMCINTMDLGLFHVKTTWIGANYICNFETFVSPKSACTYIQTLSAPSIISACTFMWVWVQCNLAVLAWVDVGRLGCSSLAAQPADIHPSEKSLTPSYLSEMPFLKYMLIQLNPQC